MNYSAYKKARDYAWAILKIEKTSALPVPIVDICHKFGVVVKYFKPNHGEKGMIMNLFGVPHIFVSPKLSEEERRYIIAHELGHFLLGHLKHFEFLMYYEYQVGKYTFEDQASTFATRLLSPACVLNSCNVRSWQDIERLCKLPRKIAKLRMARLNTLKKRNMFLTSELEKAVYENFEDYIKKHDCKMLFPDNE